MQDDIQPLLRPLPENEETLLQAFRRLAPVYQHDLLNQVLDTIQNQEAAQEEHRRMCEEADKNLNSDFTVDKVLKVFQDFNFEKTAWRHVPSTQLGKDYELTYELHPEYLKKPSAMTSLGITTILVKRRALVKENPGGTVCKIFFNRFLSEDDFNKVLHSRLISTVRTDLINALDSTSEKAISDYFNSQEKYDSTVKRLLSGKEDCLFFTTDMSKLLEWLKIRKDTVENYDKIISSITRNVNNSFKLGKRIAKLKLEAVKLITDKFNPMLNAIEEQAKIQYHIMMT